LLVREAKPEEFAALGDITVAANLLLEGMPSLEEGAPYYDDLRNVAGRAESDSNVIVAALDAGSMTVLGGLTFITRGYGRPWGIDDASGIRMLAVDAAAQGRGVGEALVLDVLERSRLASLPFVLLHTASPMKAAQRLYERLGFNRDEAIDRRFMGTDLMGYRFQVD
jgi:ribosomal protein S18 acetylase RimI-like enzyme